MGDVYIRFPVTCPVCSVELLTAFRFDAVVDTLDNAAPLRLSAACHAAAWDASSVETEQIRDYLLTAINFTCSAEPWMSSEKNPAAVPEPAHFFKWLRAHGGG